MFAIFIAVVYVEKIIVAFLAKNNLPFLSWFYPNQSCVHLREWMVKMLSKFLGEYHTPVSLNVMRNKDSAICFYEVHYFTTRSQYLALLNTTALFSVVNLKR